MQVSATEDFKKPVSVLTTVVDNVAYANYLDIDNAHRQLFGKSPAAKTTYVRFELTLTHNGTTVRFGGADIATRTYTMILYLHLSALSLPAQSNLWAQSRW